MDAIVVGGGMVGATLACALAGVRMRVALVEAVAPRAPTQPSFDERVVALSLVSRRILEGLGVWAGVESHATPIRSIHVSDRGGFGFTHLEAQEEGLEAFGFVVAARQIGAAVSGRLEGEPELMSFCPARLAGVQPHACGVRVQVEGKEGRRVLEARVLVAADGGESLARRLAGVQARRLDYGQAALTATVMAERDHGHRAFERFTDSGPLALLPMDEGRCSLVWTGEPSEVEALRALEEEQFLAALQRRFGWRLGAFVRVGPRVVYPLSLIRAERLVADRVAIIGNAAHTLHPVAGQGLNLGLRDVAALAEVMADSFRAGSDPGDARTLRRYAEWQREDHRRVIGLTDALVRLFSNRLWPLAMARNLGLLGLDLLPPLRGGFARRAMGVAYPQPRLARGAAL